MSIIIITLRVMKQRICLYVDLAVCIPSSDLTVSHYSLCVPSLSLHAWQKENFIKTKAIVLQLRPLLCELHSFDYDHTSSSVLHTHIVSFDYVHTSSSSSILHTPIVSYA